MNRKSYSVDSCRESLGMKKLNVDSLIMKCVRKSVLVPCTVYWTHQTTEVYVSEVLSRTFIYDLLHYSVCRGCCLITTQCIYRGIVDRCGGVSWAGVKVTSDTLTSARRAVTSANNCWVRSSLDKILQCTKFQM